MLPTPDDAREDTFMSNTQPRAAFEIDYSARVQGEAYTAFLAAMHQHLEPKRYLEIGVATGMTLALAQCASLGVDPQINISSNVLGTKPALHLFQMTSDAFFEAHDPREFLGGEIDFAFLDGLHRFEYLLRDFMNTERCCRPDSVIAMHDCLSPGIYITARDEASPELKKSRFQGSWCGDVWKVVPILQQYRPDLKIIATDAQPSGLVLVTDLAPSSTVLSDNYEAILSDFDGLGLMPDRFNAFWSSLDVTPTSVARSVLQAPRSA
jgi:predicted O-methyltransferase YrrM